MEDTEDVLVGMTCSGISVFYIGFCAGIWWCFLFWVPIINVVLAAVSIGAMVLGALVILAGLLAQVIRFVWEMAAGLLGWLFTPLGRLGDKVNAWIDQR